MRSIQDKKFKQKPNMFLLKKILYDRMQKEEGNLQMGK